MDRLQPQFTLSRIPIGAHRIVHGLFCSIGVCLLADWTSSDDHSDPHRVFADLCRGTLSFRRGLRRPDWGALRLPRHALDSAFNPRSEIGNPKLNGGGGGIRTHEGFRPAGFQDRSHQPLDHPSNIYVGPYFVTGCTMSKAHLNL